MTKHYEEKYKTKLKKGDKVQVIAGKNKGAVGKIQLVDRSKGVFFIEGVNLQKKHMKPNQKNQRGGIMVKEGPVHFSNALLFSEKAGKGLRIKMVINKDGEKERAFVEK